MKSQSSSAATMSASLLEALLESARLLHSSLDLDRLLKHLLRTVMGRRLITKGVIAVSDQDGMKVALSRGVSGLKAGDPFEVAEAQALGLEQFFDIKDEDRVAGIMALGKSFRSSAEAEDGFLEALLGIAASGIGNARAHAQTRRLNLDLEQKVHDLRTLLEMVQSLTSTLNPDDVARILAFTLAGRWAVSRYAVAAWKNGHAPVMRSRGLELPPAETVLQELESIPEAELVGRLPAGELKSVLSEKQGQVVFPLRSGRQAPGLIALGPRAGGQPYQQADLEFGAGLVGQSVVAFENGWHFHETLEKRRLEQEIGLAAAIQQDLFPTTIPAIAGFETAASSRAARQVGGDYYDALMIGDGGEDRPCLACVVDVSGKGIPASLLMSHIQATLRALLSDEIQLVELVGRTSALLYDTTPANKYATAILVRVAPHAKTVRYVNAGHNDGLLLKADGRIVHCKSTGPPLGLLPGIPFAQNEVEMEPGDLLALYSDGVVEAQNASEEEFEEGRFIECLKGHRDRSPEALIEDVFSAIDAFAGATPQHDDITLFLLKRTE